MLVFSRTNGRAKQPVMECALSEKQRRVHVSSVRFTEVSRDEGNEGHGKISLIEFHFSKSLLKNSLALQLEFSCQVQKHRLSSSRSLLPLMLRSSVQ